MANSYHKVLIHSVFAVKYRAGIIQPAFKDQLESVIANLLQDQSCVPMAINAQRDHVHCLFRLIPRLALSAVMQSVKAKSSKWLNETSFLRSRFEWQRGYGAFSIGHEAKDDVVNYIVHQDAHHKRATFIEEYLGLLKKYELSFDEEYIFHPLV